MDHVHVKLTGHNPIKTTPCHTPIYAFWLHRVYPNFNNPRENDAAVVCMWRQYRSLAFNALPNYCSGLLAPNKRYLRDMNEYCSSQHRQVTTQLCGFLGKLGGYGPFWTIYVSFQDLGKILKILDCPRNSGTVGACASCGWHGVWCFCQDASVMWGSAGMTGSVYKQFHGFTMSVADGTSF